MAQEHDLFDDIIEISKGFDFLKNPLGGVTDALDPSAPQWNPADYKERPRGNTIPCLTCKNEKSGCTACMDVCPVNAIEVEEDAIEILDSCRKCGLCAAACPTEAIISPRLAPKNLYDDIVSAESTYCLGCGACVKVCPEHALKLVEHDASNLVVADPEAEEKAAQKAKAHEEAEKVKAEAKAKLDKMLDQVEKLAD